MLDIAAYTHPGGHAINLDALRHKEREEDIYAALCDGLNGAGGANEAAAYCADALVEAMLCGTAPSAALIAVAAELQEKQAASVQYKASRTTASVMCFADGACRWANVGDTRLYHFSGGMLCRHSIDDSAAYAAYLAGEIAYADLRMHPHRTRLTACLGDAREVVPHEEAFAIAPGDALLLCSDGLWQYIYETEMEIDLVKSATAQEWLNAMLLRLMHRSRRTGDNLSALCCFVGGRESA